MHSVAQRVAQQYPGFRDDMLQHTTNEDPCRLTTDRKAYLVTKEHLQGAQLKAIADKYNVTPSYVSYLTRRAVDLWLDEHGLYRDYAEGLSGGCERSTVRGY